VQSVLSWIPPAVRAMLIEKRFEREIAVKAASRLFRKGKDEIYAVCGVARPPAYGTATGIDLYSGAGPFHFLPLAQSFVFSHQERDVAADEITEKSGFIRLDSDTRFQISSVSDAASCWRR
jgi:hypothetical protein